jgi:hypothetical protein
MGDIPPYIMEKIGERYSDQRSVPDADRSEHLLNWQCQGSSIILSDHHGAIDQFVT